MNARAAIAVLLALCASAVPVCAHQQPQPARPAASAPVARQVTTPAADAARAGHYYLQGVMETGSELQLGEQGAFEWYFSYGALDLAARGRWRHEGGDVILDVEEFLAPDGYQAMKFDRLKLRADGADLVPAWPWDGGAERGRYVRD